METSRRKFIRGCFAAAGVFALGSFGCTGGCNSRRAGAMAANLTQTKSPVNGLSGGGGSRNSNTREASYLALARSGELERREQAIWKMFERCNLCPRRCGVNRTAGERGICGSADTFKVASFGPHFGEERPLVGRGGSGTIFFSNCNLLCVFCQNWEINHRGDGNLTTHTELANMMLSLQRRGCHNINFVTPTHIAPHIISALRIAIDNGLTLPLVYNTSGYDSLELIQLLDGIVDIYLPDFKYQDEALAARFSRGAPDVPKHTATAVKEMHRQTGILAQHQSVAYRGLLIRHLVLPENAAGTDGFVSWVASELSPETHVNIMGQYRPQFRANEFPPLDRRPTQAEINQAMRWAREAGLRNFH